MSLKESADQIKHAAFCLILFIAPSFLYANIQTKVKDPVKDSLSDKQLFDQVSLKLEVKNLSGLLQFYYQMNMPYRTGYLLKRLKDIAPESPEYFYFASLEEYTKGNRVLASDFLDRCLKVAPIYDPAWNLKGVILNDAERYSEAVKAFQNAVKESQYDPTYQYNFALALMKINKSKDALKHVQLSIKYKPNFREAYHLKGKLLSSSGKWKEAAEAFKSAHEFGMNDTLFMIDYLKSLQKANDDMTALALFEKLASTTNPEILRQHASLRIKYGEYPRAASILETVIKQKNSNEEDKELYLYCIKRSGKNPLTAIDALPISQQEKNSLIEFSHQLEKKTDVPNVKDPTINPAQ